MEVKLTKVRLSFPDIFVPVAYPGTDRLRYNATFLIEPGSANDKAIQAAIDFEATNTWGDKAVKTLSGMKGNANKYCYLDGDTKEYDGYAGLKYLAAHSTVRPLVIDRDKSPLTSADGRPYAGCYVTAFVAIYCQKGDNPGVRASFSGIQFQSNGESFGGGGKSASPDQFDVLPDEDDDDIL